MDPEGHWLLSANNNTGGVLWPLHSKYPRVLESQSIYVSIAFTPDGRSLVSTSEDTVRLWPLSPAAGETYRTLMEDGNGDLSSTPAVDPLGRYVLVNSYGYPRVFLISLTGGETKQMPGFTRGEGWVFAMAFSPDGRLAFAAGDRPAILRIWDLETAEVRKLDLRKGREPCRGEAEPQVDSLEVLTNNKFLTADKWGIRAWNLDEETSEEIRPCQGVKGEYSLLSLDPTRSRLLILDRKPTEGISALTLYDLTAKTFREIRSHGNRVSAIALDPTGTIAVTGDLDGVVRVGPITGEEPHLLFADAQAISSVAVSPDGKWIASGSQDGTIRLWPMPEGTPFHTLPYEELLNRIRSMTNLRVVPDESSGTGYRVEIGPFPGWAKLPEW